MMNNFFIYVTAAFPLMLSLRTLLSASLARFDGIEYYYYISIRMEPAPIGMAIQPPDIIGDLLRARHHQLGSLYPEFREEFLQCERKLREHAEMLKGRKEQNSEELNKHVIEQLELREYRLARPKFSIKQTKSKPFLPRRPDQTNRPSNEDDSRRSSELSETGFRPYHISNFKKSLQNYKIHFPEGFLRQK